MENFLIYAASILFWTSFIWVPAIIIFLLRKHLKRWKYNMERNRLKNEMLNSMYQEQQMQDIRREIEEENGR